MKVNLKKQKFSYKLNLQKIELVNFRLFENILLYFNEKLTVIIGQNGAGKTTILDAIANNLQLLINNLTNTNYKKGLVFLPTDIKYDQNSAQSKISFNFQSKSTEINETTTEINVAEEDFDNLMENVELNNKDILEWDLEIYKDKYATTKDNFELIYQLGNKIHQNIQLKNSTIQPFFLFIKSDDSVPNSLQKVDIEIDKEINIFELFDNNNLNFYHFTEWFKWQERIEFQLKKKQKQLEIIKSAIYKTLSEETKQFKNLHTDYLQNKDGELIIEKNNSKLNISLLSSGEKRILSIVSQITYHLLLANYNETKPLNGSGIVLIDEIDLHLHPQWQRKVIPQLRKTFPNIQFIVTTHSPLVLQNVERENVIVLEDGKIQEFTEIYTKGIEPNRILEELMQTPLRDLETLEKIEKLANLLTPEHFEEEETNVLFEKLYLQLGKQDPFIMRAQHRMMILKRQNTNK